MEESETDSSDVIEDVSIVTFVPFKHRPYITSEWMVMCVSRVTCVMYMTSVVRDLWDLCVCVCDYCDIHYL